LVSTIIGVGVGFIFIKYKKIGGFFLATWGGFSMGLLFYNAVLYKIDSEIALWCFTLGIGLLYGMSIFFFFDHILIHTTSFLGAFSALFGIGLVAGKYPNPFTIVQMMQNGIFTEIDPAFYGYFAGTLVLYVIGCVWQYRVLNQKRRLNKELKGSMTSSTLEEPMTEKNKKQGKELF
jgi:H+/gluconate symporter-like permease